MMKQDGTNATEQPGAETPLPLNWRHGAAELKSLTHAGEPRDYSVSTTDKECAALAGLMDINGCSSIAATYAIRPLHKGRFALTGRLSATITQSCVVTLADAVQKIDEELDAEFWPEDQLSRPDKSGAAKLDISAEELEARDIEAITEGVIDMGRLVYEQLVTALDPYPRAPGVAFDSIDDNTDDDRATGSDSGSGATHNPFAALAGLKDKL